MSVKVVTGNILDCQEEVIFHQCNCVSTEVKGLAESLFEKYPYSNTYKNRTQNKSVPGTVDVCPGDKIIINAYAQYYPGRAKYANDNQTKRIEFFNNCLNQLLSIESITGKDIAMPYNIGCGMAGGDWQTYYDIICQFSLKNNINIVLYRF